MSIFLRCVVCCPALPLCVLCGPSSEAFAPLPRGAVHPDDWPTLGGSPSRNMLRPQRWKIPDTWNVTKGSNIVWSVDLGTKAHGGPVIADGKIFIGTNNDNPRDPNIKRDKGVLMCFREKDGKFLWQAVHDKLAVGRVADWPHAGILSTPAIDGKRLYYVSNRAELVCADVDGDGKGGPKFYWKLDMIQKLEVFPHNKSVSSPLVVGDLVYVVTGNGVAADHLRIPSPNAPSFIAVDKKTGNVVWSSNAPGTRIMHTQWSSPTLAVIDEKQQIIFPGGDGWLYSFEPKKGTLLWKFDCNPKDAKQILGGKGTKNDFIAAPVVWKNYVYIGVGQDPEHNKGVGHLWCIDLKKAMRNRLLNANRDVSPTLLRNPAIVPNPASGLGWHFGGFTKPADLQRIGRPYYFGRSLSMCAIADGLLYTTEYDGWVHCFDARTGKRHWYHDMRSDSWTSPTIIDNKVFVGNEQGEVHIFRHAAKKQKPKVIEMIFGSMVRTPAVAANRRLYVLTENPCTLYAIEKK